jgi:hypothetical protein
MRHDEQDKITLDAIWDYPKALSAFENIRYSRRGEGRISFDCFMLHCHGNRAFCKLGYTLGTGLDGTIPLVSALRGWTSGVCKVCKNFDD